jgi:hypothetical protein
MNELFLKVTGRLPLTIFSASRKMNYIALRRCSEWDTQLVDTVQDLR